MSHTLSRRKVMPCKFRNRGSTAASLRRNVICSWLESEAGGLNAQDGTLLSPWYAAYSTPDSAQLHAAVAVAFGSLPAALFMYRCTDSLRVRTDAPSGWLRAGPHHLLKLPRRPACTVGAAEPCEDSWRLQALDSQCIIACCGPALPGCSVHGNARSCWLSQSCLSAEGRRTEEGVAI